MVARRMIENRLENVMSGDFGIIDKAKSANIV